MGQVARPSYDDPWVRAGSESIGGPPGRHARPHRWWTPLRVVLAVTAVTFLLGMAQKTPCETDHWTGGETRFAKMCYSDVPYLYAGRGFAERLFPYADNGGRYQTMEYPVVISYFAYGTALVTQALSGWPDLSPRAQAPADQIMAQPGVAAESGRFFEVTTVLLAPFALLAAGLLARAQRNRPWDAMLFAAAPVLALSGLINWDLLSVAAVAGALWAWSRGRPLLTGALIGLGTATKLYPVFLLGALLVVCWRRRELAPLAATTLTAAATWLLVNLPAMILGYAQWQVFWTFNDRRGADLGSLWLVWQDSGHLVTTDAINLWSGVAFAAVCLGVLLLGLRARRTPRIASLALLIVTGFLIVNKVYSPQYVLWLLPLAVLARPRWRDLIVWQACEIFYFGAVWLHLGNFTASSVSGQPDSFYWLAIGIRVAGELYLAAVVVRDILWPHHDPVRADGLSDDPLHPETRAGPEAEPSGGTPGETRGPTSVVHAG